MLNSENWQILLCLVSKLREFRPWRQQYSYSGAQTLQFLKKLHVLILSLNCLKAIEKNAFSAITYLCKLEGAYNVLSSFQAGLFLGLENLEFLNPSLNKITYETTVTAISSFINLKSLKQLNLERQVHGIQVVPTNFFPRAKCLTGATPRKKIMVISRLPPIWLPDQFHKGGYLRSKSQRPKSLFT